MGGNFIFRSSGARSPFGSAYVSGSHCGNKAYWAGTGGSYSSRVNIDIRNYNAGCHGGYYGGGIFGTPYMGGYYGGGCCGGAGGISEKGAWWALGIGAGIGLLASPLGKPIINGIGTGLKYAWKGISWLGQKTWQGAKWLGQKAWQGISWAGKQIGNTFAYIGKGFANWFTGKKWSTNNEWDKCHANK